MADTMNAITSFIGEHYHWQATLLALAVIIVVTRIGYYLAFRVPALQQARDFNLAEDQRKEAQPKYPPVMKASRRVGAITNLVFFIAILPFCITLAYPGIGWVLLNTVLILMVYDFFYYLSHRFWFHGNGWMRRVHAVHHQARNPTHVDAYYVHPFETFVGLALYLGTVALLAVLTGPFHVSTIILTYLIFVQVNIINHTHVDLPYFPFRTLSWITAKHHVHHENMHKGNYATITLLYDKLFGTLD